MKVEIEYEEIEQLKAELKRAINDKFELEEKLNSLNEENLRKNAKDLAMMLFKNYVTAIFNKIGFDNQVGDSVFIPEDLEYWLGKNWWNSPRLKVTLSASIKESAKKAFIELLVMPKERKDEE